MVALVVSANRIGSGNQITAAGAGAVSVTVLQGISVVSTDGGVALSGGIGDTAAFTLSNSGRLTSMAPGQDGADIVSGGTGSMFVHNYAGGLIESFGAQGLTLADVAGGQQAAGAQVINEGVISGYLAAVGITGVAAGSVFNSGTMTSSFNTVTATGGSTFFLQNSGLIEGTLVTGRAVATAGSVDTVQNSGTISGSINLGGQAAISDQNDTAADTLTNSGTITGAITLGGGANVVNNSGYIGGSVTGGTSADTVNNEAGGQIVSGISLSGGANRFTNAGVVNGGYTGGAAADNVNNLAGGRIDGTIAFANGDNVLTNGGYLGGLGSGSVTSGTGDDRITNYAGAHLVATIQLGDGANRIINFGDIYGALQTGSGNDNVQNNAGASFATSLLLGDGDNTVRNSGDISALTIAGVGNDLFVNFAGGVARSAIFLGSGDNTLNNHGAIADYNNGLLDITASEGNDTLRNTGAMQVHDISLGDGINALRNGAAGTIDANSLIFGSGAGTIVNHGSIETGSIETTTDAYALGIENYGHFTVEGDVTQVAVLENHAGAHFESLSVFFANPFFNTLINAGDIKIGTLQFAGADGDPALVNTGTMTVGTAAGIDGIANAGMLSGQISFGGGDDLFSNTGTFNGIVDLGVGNDVFSGNQGVLGAYGLVPASGGYSREAVEAFGQGSIVNGGDGNDVIRTGRGDDFLLGGAGADILNGGDGNDTALYSNSTSVIVSIDGTPGVNSDASGDKLLNIENLGGSSADDILTGNEGANILAGGAGSDTLTGNGGDDLIFGDDGTDTLLGNAGADTLYGGGGADMLTGGTEKDLFVFTQLSDSTVAVPGRDKITDFTHGQDVIALSGIGFDVLLETANAAFTHTAGELRYTVSGGTATLLGDFDGDGTADFSILLQGVTSLTYADFSFS